jgi:hypothetical protein
MLRAAPRAPRPRALPPPLLLLRSRAAATAAVTAARRATSSPRAARMAAASPPAAASPLAPPPPHGDGAARRSGGGFGSPLRSFFASRLFSRGADTATAAATTAAAVTAATSAASPPRHLFFLVHGLAGQPEDLSCLRDNLLRLSGGRAAVHLSRANVARGASTRDGIEGTPPTHTHKLPRARSAPLGTAAFARALRNDASSQGFDTPPPLHAYAPPQPARRALRPSCAPSSPRALG